MSALSVRRTFSPAGRIRNPNTQDRMPTRRAPRREFLVPTKQSAQGGLAAMQQRLSRSEQARRKDKHSITVDRLPPRTTALHGITGPELERLSDAVRFLTLQCQGCRTALWLATTNRGAGRSIIADIWKRITRLQTRYDLPAYSVVVLETRGGLHAHHVHRHPRYCQTPARFIRPRRTNRRSPGHRPERSRAQVSI
jgi:hypothetical protein